MRRLHVGLLVAGLPLLVACLALTGCKKVEETNDQSLWADLRGGSKGGKNTTPMKPIAMGKGVIMGKVVWKGNKPARSELDSVLANMKPDTDVCLAGKPDEKNQQAFRLGNNGNVGNVVVWIAPPDRNTYFALTDADMTALKLPKQVLIDQPHCAFVPHVATAFTHYPDPADPRNELKPTEEIVTVKNNALTITHNTKWAGGNVQLGPGSFVNLPLVPESQPVRIQCSIHQWMDAYVYDFNHPYTDVTKCDNLAADDAKYGTFEIHNVPTNVKLKLAAWHESGTVVPVGGDDIELSDKDGKEPSKEVVFEFTKK